MNTFAYDIPDKTPPTQSFLFMPLILHSMDPRVIQVTFPDKFKDAFEDSTKQFEDEKGKLDIKDNLPFTTLEELRGLITAKLKEKGFCKYRALSEHFDSEFHLPGNEQEDILYGYAGLIETFLGYLVKNVINLCKGQKIQIKKISAGGSKSRRRRNRGRKSRRR